MIKKFTILFFAIVVASCSTNKSVVRTTKAEPQVVHSAKKPAHTTRSQTELPTNTQIEKSAQKNVGSTEVLEATTRVKVTTQMVLDYIEKYKDVAKDNMRNTGIPASITLGQAILESGAGTGPLSVQANNHFGIKCHKEWTGDSISYTDDEENECFRKYVEPKQSFVDHSFFLTSRPRYSELFQFEKDDYKSWAYGLKAAGYATDPKYPVKLITLIEKYNLNKFDAEILGKEFIPKIEKKEISYNENTPKYTIIKGDTLYSISKKFSISIEELKKKNNIIDNTLSLGQTIIVK